MGLHHLKQGVYYLAHVLAEGLAILQSVNGLEDLYVELDLLWGHSVRADPKEHWDDNVEIVAEDGYMKVSNGIHGLDCDLDIMCTLVLN